MHNYVDIVCGLGIIDKYSFIAFKNCFIVSQIVLHSVK